MQVFITRPAADGQDLADKLRALPGAEPVLTPLLEIIGRPGPAISLESAQALAFTSANGVRAFAARQPDREIPVLAVGPASAEAARKAGFSDIREAAGDVAALADLIIRTCKPSGGVIHHMGGAALAGDLAGALSAEGFTVERHVLYEARKATALPGPIRTALERAEPSIVCAYSPRTARTLRDLVSAGGLTAQARALTLIALSPAVAEAIHPLQVGAVEVARVPQSEDILALVRHRVSC